MRQSSVSWVRLNMMGEPVEVAVSAPDHSLYRLLITEKGDIARLPNYMHERIALLKLSGVNNANAVGDIGRRLSERYLTVYLTYDEYTEITELFNGECNEEADE